MHGYNVAIKCLCRIRREELRYRAHPISKIGDGNFIRNETIVATIQNNFCVGKPRI